MNEKDSLRSWFSFLQKEICETLESIEDGFSKQRNVEHRGTHRFEKKTWQRALLGNIDEGGGIMKILQGGNVFEKAGVNVSTVYGEFSPEFRKEIPGTEDDPRFWASGLSLVIHPRNPFVPAVHFNTRHIITSKSWFGGGSDLTPVFPNDEDAHAFHHVFKEPCDHLDRESAKENHHFQGESSSYEKYRKACDDYFYLPHRKEARGIGGIFYDYLSPPCFNIGFNFTRNVGKAFLAIYPNLVRKHFLTPWTEEAKKKQLIKRGRYAEFNLLYDRGTRFGLMTGGNTEAILMSLPPEVVWKVNLKDL